MRPHVCRCVWVLQANVQAQLPRSGTSYGRLNVRWQLGSPQDSSSLEEGGGGEENSPGDSIRQKALRLSWLPGYQAESPSGSVQPSV